MNCRIKITSQDLAFKAPKDVKRLFNILGSFLVSSTQEKINQGIKPENAPLTQAVKKGNKTLRDTGGLLASITREVRGKTIMVGTNHPGAKSNDGEQTIRARQAGFLVIPASSKTRTFQRRYGMAVSGCLSGLRRDGHSVYRLPTKTGGFVLMAKKGTRGIPFAVFYLKKEVKIPQRRFLFLSEADKKAVEHYLKDGYFGGV